MSYEREGISPQIIDWLTVTQEIFDNFQLLYRYYDYYSEICTGLPTVDNDKQYNILIFDDLDEDLSINSSILRGTHIDEVRLLFMCKTHV